MSQIIKPNRSPVYEANFENNISDDEPCEESQHTQSQIESTQLTQPGLTPDESMNVISASSNHAPLSPPSIIPYGRIIPCVPSAKLTAIDLMPTQESYWLGRSQKCDVTAQYSSRIWKTLSKTEIASLEWGKSMISNRHCRIFFEQNNGNQIFIEDNSGNGTFINQQTHLRKGETRILHSGDEICLINMETLRKKISSYRVIQMVSQQFSFIVVQSKPRKSCVNPRAMNYFFRNQFGNSRNEKQQSSSHDSSAGRHIETFYEIREILGDGTSGQVRRAIHRQSGEERAVKIISLKRQVDLSTMEREVKLLQSLDHPYIVKLVESFVQPGVAMYLVMELVKGGDLFDSIIEKERYAEIEARHTMRRLLSAVHYLHHHSNIVHRDLKPENILCSSPTHVKLADFGLAKTVTAGGLKTFCGTPAYFAPEVLQRRHTIVGEGRYGKPADMWSLGVILYILLTGKPPFDPDTEESPKPFEVDFKSDEHIWSNVPQAKDLVEKLLCLNPQRRYTVSQACDHPWINIDDGDSHCHPLDDPAVCTQTEKKKQESKSNGSVNVTNNTSIAVTEDVNDSGFHSSNIFNLSSKKELPTAVSSQNRNGCTLSFDDGKSLEQKDIGKAITATTLNPKSSVLRTGNDIEEKSSIVKNDTEHRNGMDNNELSTRMPSTGDSSSSPRSPLMKLNFNKRSNDFRKRVIDESDSSSPSGSERVTCPGRNGEHQVAVTPTSSKMKAVLKQLDAVAGKADAPFEDPILSQFSSVLSSVESFSDSESLKSDQVSPEPIRNKRRLEKETVKNDNKTSKRAKTFNPKQTTLNAWLVKKS